jgi:hypothetical protein
MLYSMDDLGLFGEDLNLDKLLQILRKEIGTIRAMVISMPTKI